jgi:cell division protein FtsZ
MIAGLCMEEAAGALMATGLQPRIAVVGVGGAGCKIASMVYERNPEGLEVVVMNSDPRALASTQADLKVFFGSPEIASRDGVRQSALDQWGRLVALLNHDIVILILGLGGDTGGAAAPVVAEAAGANGATVLGIAVMPFTAEGRREGAVRDLGELRGAAAAVLTFDNDDLIPAAATLDFVKALELMNSMVVQVVESLHRRALGLVLDPTSSGISALGFDPHQDLMGFPVEFGDLEAEEGLAPIAVGQGGFIH